MRLVRLGQQPSRVAEDVRAALASLGRGSTVIGGVALIGARPAGDDRAVEAVVVLPKGVLIVIGVDLPDPALRLEAPLGGPWKADGWPLVHGDDAVNPATEALDLSQDSERRIAELAPGSGPVGTIVAVGPYVETVDQPPADLAGPVRVLHPTPTAMLAATVSLATARSPRSLGQARALITAVAPDAPALPDDVLLGEGFVRYSDDPPVAVVPPAPVRAAAAAARAAAPSAAPRPGAAPKRAPITSVPPPPPVIPTVVPVPAPISPDSQAESTSATSPDVIADAPTESAAPPPAPVPAPSTSADAPSADEPLGSAATEKIPAPAKPSAASALVFPSPVGNRPAPAVPTGRAPQAGAGSAAVTSAPPRPRPAMAPTPAPAPRGMRPAPPSPPEPSAGPPSAPPPDATSAAGGTGAEEPRKKAGGVRWVPVAAVALLAVLLAAAIVVAATSGGGGGEAAPPASSRAGAPAPVSSSAPASSAAPSLSFEARASSADQRCASHAFGDVQASLQQTSCSGVHRASYTALVDGRPAAVTVAVVDFPDAGQATNFKQVADNPGGGGILDVATETGKWPGPAPQFDNAAYASKTEGNGVRLVQAVWQSGPSTPDDPGLTRAAQGALGLALPS